MRCTAAGFTTELELHFGFPTEGLIVVCTHSEEVRLVEWLPFRNRATLTPNSRTLLRIARSRSTGCAVGLKTGAKVQGSMGYRLSHPVARWKGSRWHHVLLMSCSSADLGEYRWIHFVKVRSYFLMRPLRPGMNSKPSADETESQAGSLPV